MGRGKAWSLKDTMLLTRAIVKVSHDPITACGQKKTTYYNRVYEAFINLQKQAAPDSSTLTTRTVVAMENRWKSVQADINKFVGFYTKATSITRSGYQDDDYVKLANEMYTLDCNSEFELVDVWNYLRNEVPKFEDILIEGGATPTIGTIKGERKRQVDEAFCAKESVDETKPSDVRPIGAKRAKEIVAEEMDMTSFRKKFINTQEKRAVLLDETNEIAIMSRDLSNERDENVHEYFDLKRKQIITKMKSSIV